MNGIDMTTKGRKETTSAFGYFEMAEFAESHDDPRVLLMWKKIKELRGKLARTAAHVVELEKTASATGGKQSHETTEAMR